MFNLFSNRKEGYIDVPGGKIWYCVVGKNKKNPPLVVLHGGPGYPHDSLIPLEELANERQIIFYDQLGCGNSEKTTDKSLWKVERFVEELQTIIEFLSLDSFHLLGHSWGGVVVTEYALTQPKRLKSLILASPFLGTKIWLEDAKKNIETLSKHTQFVLQKRDYFLKNSPREYEKATAEYYNNFLCRVHPYPAPMMKAYETTNYDIYHYMWGPEEFVIDGTLKNYDLTKRLHEIKIPVMLTSGKYDEISPESASKIVRLFPNASNVIFEKSAHMPHLEEKELYVKSIRNFLKL